MFHVDKVSMLSIGVVGQIRILIDTAFALVKDYM